MKRLVLHSQPHRCFNPFRLAPTPSQKKPYINKYRAWLSSPKIIGLSAAVGGFTFAWALTLYREQQLNSNLKHHDELIKEAEALMPRTPLALRNMSRDRFDSFTRIHTQLSQRTSELPPYLADNMASYISLQSFYQGLLDRYLPERHSNTFHTFAFSTADIDTLVNMLKQQDGDDHNINAILMATIDLWKISNKKDINEQQKAMINDAIMHFAHQTVYKRGLLDRTSVGMPVGVAEFNKIQLNILDDSTTAGCVAHLLGLQARKNEDFLGFAADAFAKAATNCTFGANDSERNLMSVNNEAISRLRLAEFKTATTILENSVNNNSKAAQLMVSPSYLILAKTAMVIFSDLTKPEKQQICNELLMQAQAFFKLTQAYRAGDTNLPGRYREPYLRAKENDVKALEKLVIEFSQTLNTDALAAQTSLEFIKRFLTLVEKHSPSSSSIFADSKPVPQYLLSQLRLLPHGDAIIAELETDGLLPNSTQQCQA